jgi:hypothetical protein
MAEWAATPNPFRRTLVTALHDRQVDPLAPIVRLTDTAVHIDRFTETDPEVVAALRDATDLVAAIHTRLQLGTRVLALANSTGEVEYIRAEIDRLTTAVSAAVTDSVGKVAKTTEGLLDSETGALAATLRTFGAHLTSLLGDTFDPARRDSVMAKIETLVADMLKHTGDRQLASFRRIINPDSDDSPLGRFRQELVKTVTDQVGTVLGELRTLNDAVAGQAAAAEVFELTSHKGFQFEVLLHGMVERVAVGHGDLAVQTGGEAGVCGTKKGDEVVTLNPDDTRGAHAAYVFEVKDRKVSLRKILEEVDAAMANREASAGIAVFSSQDRAPTTVPFTPYGRKAVLVLDKADPDPYAVRLACMWGRWIVSRELAATGVDGADLGRIAGQLDTARHALTRVTSIRRAHTAARTSIGHASSELDALTEDLRTVLDAIADELTAG